MDKESEQTDPRRLVTAKQCWINIVSGLLLILFCCAGGIYLLSTNDVGLGSLYAALVIFLTALTVKEWKKSVAVKNGAVLYVSSKARSRADLFVSMDSVLSLTLLAFVFSGLCFWAWHLTRQSASPVGLWLIIFCLNGALWGCTLYCWYRLLMRRLHSEPAMDQDDEEGVWPPPPNYSQ